MIPRPLASALALALFSWPAAAFAPDRAYALAASGWSLELFGTDVAILRARMTAGSEPPARSGLLVLSCEGAERRLRLSLPDRLDAGAGATGAILMRGAGAGGAASGRVAIADDRALTLKEAGPGASVVLAVAGLLAAMPARVDLLVSVGAPPVLLSRLLAIVVTPSFRSGDALAFEQFARACARAGRR